MKYLKIVADSNDADYVTSFNSLREEDEDLINKLAKLILQKEDENKENYFHNWPNKEWYEVTPRDLYPELTEEEHDVLFYENYIPSCEDGIHTIESIEILEVSNVKVLL